MGRRKARETAFKVLYQVDLVQAVPGEAYRYLMEDAGLKQEKDRAFCQDLINGCLEHLEEIDHRIAEHARDWNIERMPVIDRNIIRMALFEMLYIEGSQKAVVIDEAVEIAKKYSDAGSSSFINALLDKIDGGGSR